MRPPHRILDRKRVYRLAELVLDVPSLLARLAELSGDGLLGGERIEPLRENGELAGLRVDGREIRARRVVLSAGQGNAGLLHDLGLAEPAQTCQRRTPPQLDLSQQLGRPAFQGQLEGVVQQPLRLGILSEQVSRAAEVHQAAGLLLGADLVVGKDALDLGLDGLTALNDLRLLHRSVLIRRRSRTSAGL